ncbi:hypothetical protein PWT90_02132 [Aphanocladium album]|nr:hypothetical protein PWT90_02132 [Aphanocladium album]
MEQTIIAFDLYGTLLSTESIATELAKLYGDEKAKLLAARARTLQLEYTWRSNSMKRYESFSNLTRWSFRHAAAELGVDLSPADEERVLNAYNGLDTFSDANSGLEILAGAESVTAYVFSNGDPSMLASSMSTSPALAQASRVLPRSRIISVEPLRVFKPDPSVYGNLVEIAGKKGNPGSVWLVSSNPFDVCGAAASGLKSAWVDRTGKGWLDGLATGAGNNPNIVVKGVDEAVKRILDVTTSFEDDSSQLYVGLTSTVLALRGSHTIAQPLLDPDSGSALCWNGEAWRIQGAALSGNDGEIILSKLTAASVHGQKAILDTLRAIEGPFAFVFVDKPSKTLYYGRDRLGRRSLLVNPEFPFQLSSISDTSCTGWLEVEADGCYIIPLTACSLTSTVEPVRHDWDSNQELHRVQGVPLPPGVDESQARVAVLFSGGLDCTVLARLTDELLPSDQEIDLLNVAFENPRIAAQHKGLELDKLYELCPDRITGRQSFDELVKTCPQRTWRFVAVNVPYSDTTSHRDTVVGLIYPHNTEMDLSIACALYFAARGEGFAQTGVEAESLPYATTARVLLSGLGADELFGGYSRHGIAYQRHGYEGLVEELKLDVGRLGKRNLGRDDRAMSHWSREVRFPFLDESLVKWAIETEVWQKCDFGKDPNGEEGVEAAKRILRLLARDLGLEAAALEKKRANGQNGKR